MTKHLLTLALVAALAACGGNNQKPEATLVELCVADIKAPVLSCLGAEYDGRSTTQLSACLAAKPTLVTAIKLCRAKGAAEFQLLADHAFGHSARVVLSQL